MTSLATKFPILKSWKAILISMLASMFEFYDFGILGFFTLSIGKALFPPTLTELEYHAWIYGLFWAGFSTRPLGGACFGYISDLYGRKKAFRLSITIMAICTFLTGCIPTYNIIGIFAPIILLILRLIQGISTGGEISSVFVYLYEIAPKHRRATWMSFIVISSFGALLATLVKITITQILTTEQTLSWGWRIPFWIGILLAVLGWCSKYALERTPVFVHMVQEHNSDNGSDNEPNIADQWLRSSVYIRRRSESENPFTVACCDNSRTTVIFVFATALNQLTPFMMNVFLPDYLTKESMHGWPDDKAYQFNAYNMIISAIVIVFIGICTDTYGPLRFLIVSSVLTAIISPFAWYSFTLTTKEWHDFLISLVMVIVPNITNGAVYFWYIDTLLIDPRTRTRIFGVAFNIGAVLFAGTAPYLGTFFIQTGGITVGAILTGSWISLTALISLSAYLYKYFKNPIQYQGYMEQYASNDREEQQELTAKERAHHAYEITESCVEHDYIDKLNLQ